MTRKRADATERYSAEWRAKVTSATRHALARKRERERRLARIEPLDIREVRAGRCKHPLLTPLAEQELEKLDALYEDLGGFDQLSTARRAIGADWARLGVVLGSELERYSQTRDPECVSRISSLVNTRRAQLSALGLERLAREVPRLDDYVASRSQNGAGATVDVTGESSAGAEGSRPL